jgi:hypothetical protein
MLDMFALIYPFSAKVEFKIKDNHIYFKIQVIDGIYTQ